jgi:hypothetical protein
MSSPSECAKPSYKPVCLVHSVCKQKPRKGVKSAQRERERPAKDRAASLDKSDCALDHHACQSLHGSPFGVDENALSV